MKRLQELVSEVRRRFPRDGFFEDFESSLEIPVKRLHYARYEKALGSLDDNSWATLVQKCLAHYTDCRPGQEKQGFFNQLNEAFAYEYLIEEGCKCIQFIAEDKLKRTPDLGFTEGCLQRCCEVKSIGISDNEIFRRYQIGSPHSSVPTAGYEQLGEPFFRKLGGVWKNAKDQLEAFGCDGLVFIVVRFDDICLDYFSDYLREIRGFCRAARPQSLVIKGFKHGELVPCWPGAGCPTLGL